MKSYLQAEFLKLKHSTIQKMIIMVPLICMIMAGGFCALGGPEIVKLADITTLNHWGLIWLPASVALLAGLSHKLEEKSTGYQTIYGLPISPAKVWAAKNLAIAVALLIASILLWVFICIFDMIFIGAQLSMGTLLRCLAAAFISWIAVLWQIPLYLWLSQRISYFVLILLNCGLSILVAPIYAIQTNWWAVPWAWILRLQAPILGLHPNGIPLEAGSVLLSYTGFTAAIAISIVLMIAVTILSMWSFSKRKDGNI